VSELADRHEASGKVREIYNFGDTMLLVASDRISAFDVIMPTPIPDKGRVLTALSAFWFERTAELVPNHLISIDPTQFPAAARETPDLAGRAMLVKRLTMMPIECVVRGYLAGSGWKDYRDTGSICGLRLPDGLRESERLPRPIFTPATKAESGHDENITVGRMREILGTDITAELERLTRAVYTKGRDVALEHGIIIADTKFEFGRTKAGEIILIDEVMTPDSSRFWPADGYQPGKPQPSFDKQPLRDWLDVERHAGRWNGEAPPPKLPTEVVDATSKRYLEAYRRVTGSELKI